MAAKGNLDNKIVAIIQARMGSTRLPGKTLMDIEGKPLLWHVVNRLKSSRLIKDVIIASTNNPKDDLIEDLCLRYNITLFSGSEEDVLDRYYQAAKKYKADTIVRITSDCPLIDPHIVDEVISSYLKNISSFNGASNTIKRTYPRGLDTEVFSFYVLEQMWLNSDKDYQREHVTAYLYEHPEKFKIYSVEQKIDLSYLRWTVDEEADMVFIREIYKRLYNAKKIFFMEDVLVVLEKEPRLSQINIGIKQKNIR